MGSWSALDYATMEVDMRQTVSAEELFAAWQPWQVALAATIASEMRRHGLDADDLAALAAEYLKKSMPVPAQVEEQRGNHSAANTDQSEPAPGYCPVCGSNLEMQQHCPGKVKHFRTSIACTNDACSYWHHSHLTIRELIHGTQISA